MDHKDIIDTLNRLVETCKDGEHGFQACAGQADSAALRLVFSARAEDCRQAAFDLQSLIKEHGGAAEQTGSPSGALHRGWTLVKAALSGSSDVALLEECERGEEKALERYASALASDLPAVVRAPVEQQFEGVKRNHVQVRALLDQARAGSA